MVADLAPRPCWQPDLVAVARIEQQAIVDLYRGKAQGTADLDERARFKRMMHTADLAWAHIALWLEDPSQPPAIADQPGIYGFVRRARDAALREGRANPHITNADPKGAHWAALLAIDRLIAGSISWAAVFPRAEAPRKAAA